MELVATWIFRGELSESLERGNERPNFPEKEPGEGNRVTGIWATGGNDLCPWPFYLTFIDNCEGDWAKFPPDRSLSHANASSLILDRIKKLS